MNKELLKKLALSFGPSGYEKETADIIIEELNRLSIPVTRDSCGGVIGKIGSGEEKILLVATMDEASFMVTDIDGDGFLRMEALTAIDPRTVAGKRMTVGGDMEKVDAVSAIKVLHLRSGGERDEMGVDKVFLNMGAKNKEEAEKLTKKGEFVTFHGNFREMANDYIVCKALDGRSGCALLLEEAEKLVSEVSEDRTYILVFAVKGLAGLSSAPFTAFREKPLRAVLLDSCGADDLPDPEKEKDKQIHVSLGKGALLPMYDNQVLYYDSPEYQVLVASAEAAGIPYQQAKGCAQMSALHLTCGGVPMVSVALPCRNPRTEGVIIHKNDYESALELLHLAAIL
ncbi:MAG: M42 family metallopeptidase [Ruminococcaceae bacterium]|nr:M42 family metallopeptidase [Oscillospiraceae bacterium]